MLKQLLFKKVGNHWYLNINHDDPTDLILDSRLERFFDILDFNKFGIMDRVYIIEENFTDNMENLIQFTDSDLLRYFTTTDNFTMIVYVGKHRFTISSKLYTLLEQQYQFNFHQSIYRIIIY